MPDFTGTITGIPEEIARLQAERDRYKAEAEKLREALRDTRSDLFYQIEAQHGPRAASEYPSIVKADAALGSTHQTGVSEPGSPAIMDATMRFHQPRPCAGFIPGADPARCLHCGAKVETHNQVTQEKP